MIDHETARRSFATSLDFFLDPVEREALDEHLAGCAACRADVAAIRGDSGVLRDLDFGAVPIAVRANIAIAAEHQGGGGAIGRWIALVGVAALLIVALGGGVMGVGGRPTGTADPSAAAVDARPVQIGWKTDVATLTAREFSIVAGGKTFTAATPKIDIHADPGDATRRTLEATWNENDVEMRLSLYFGNDATDSWVDEVRIYNGAQQGEWLEAKGPFFKTPIGAAWAGDQDITLDGPGGPGRLHLAGATLENRPSTGIGKPVGGQITKPIGGGIVGPVLQPLGSGPFDAGGPLHCFGILQMTPQDAQAALRKLGVKVSWRYYTRNDTYIELRDEPPAGTVIIADGPFIGSEGQLLIALADPSSPLAKPVPLPSDCPTSNPNVTPPPPAP
jgi:hypothetical protein